MSILIAGPDANLSRLAEPFVRVAAHVDRCTTPDAAREYLRKLDRAYELAFVCSTWNVPTLQDLRALAEAHGACLVYSELATLPDRELSAFPVNPEDEATVQLNAHDVERWRNVLTFAKRTPDDYPALRDALGVQTNLFQYHAPVKRSA